MDINIIVIVAIVGAIFLALVVFILYPIWFITEPVFSNISIIIRKEIEKKNPKLIESIKSLQSYKPIEIWNSTIAISYTSLLCVVPFVFVVTHILQFLTSSNINFINEILESSTNSLVTSANNLVGSVNENHRDIESIIKTLSWSTAFYSIWSISSEIESNFNKVCEHNKNISFIKHFLYAIVFSLCGLFIFTVGHLIFSSISIKGHECLEITFISWLLLSLSYFFLPDKFKGHRTKSLCIKCAKWALLPSFAIMTLYILKDVSIKENNIIHWISSNDELRYGKIAASILVGFMTFRVLWTIILLVLKKIFRSEFSAQMDMFENANLLSVDDKKELCWIVYKSIASANGKSVKLGKIQKEIKKENYAESLTTWIIPILEDKEMIREIYGGYCVVDVIADEPGDKKNIEIIMNVLKKHILNCVRPVTTYIERKNKSNKSHFISLIIDPLLKSMTPKTDEFDEQKAREYFDKRFFEGKATLKDLKLEK